MLRGIGFAREIKRQGIELDSLLNENKVGKELNWIHFLMKIRFIVYQCKYAYNFLIWVNYFIRFFSQTLKLIL